MTRVGDGPHARRAAGCMKKSAACGAFSYRRAAAIALPRGSTYSDGDEVSAGASSPVGDDNAPFAAICAFTRSPSWYTASA